MEIHSYRDLKVWQLGVDLAAEVYDVTRLFPKSEIFGLSSQLQRAAVSVPSNIAEGHARGSTKDFIHFLNISLGSVAEVETQLLIGQRIEYVGSDTVDQLLHKYVELGKMLRALQRSLEARA
ncbi:hypothetical protein GEOBRER4_n3514 [Citrifermentans bremense]|uniref:Uncharacterized protein n=1 Tax=Citrifermentans bremense TaxID=60035 RepID=A0A6S6M5E4_9BACT|nr:four helix bundle protein [Citrifermentans bremense]BCG48619.1 hypothetical protein GEOBRER4_n3514 [Citrifermentans bremense]